jgi:hypothetical protein
MKARDISGKHLGGPPYGYRSDPQDKDHWILDEDAAPVVKRIFDLTIAGVGPSRIARILEADKLPTVKALYAIRKDKPMPERPCHWIKQSVVNILECMKCLQFQDLFKVLQVEEAYPQRQRRYVHPAWYTGGYCAAGTVGPSAGAAEKQTPHHQG